MWVTLWLFFLFILLAFYSSLLTGRSLHVAVCRYSCSLYERTRWYRVGVVIILLYADIKDSSVLWFFFFVLFPCLPVFYWKKTMSVKVMLYLSLTCSMFLDCGDVSRKVYSSCLHLLTPHSIFVLKRWMLMCLLASFVSKHFFFHSFTDDVQMHEPSSLFSFPH